MQHTLDDDWRSTEYKTFDIDKYNQYNPKEDLVIKKLDLKNIKIELNFNKKGVDRYLIKDGTIVGSLEIESHEKYWDDIFPFKTVHFLGRKKKFKNKNCFYLLFSKNLNNCLIINTIKLKDDYLINQDNAECKNEKIYDIPIDMCVFGWDKTKNYLENSV